MVVSDNFLHLISQGYPKPIVLCSVACWLLHKLTLAINATLPMIIFGPKLIAAMSAGMKRYKRSRQLGRVRPLAGQQAGGSRPDTVVHGRYGSSHIA